VTDYKKYSLGQVENFLYDAMSTEATPQEIYDVIKKVVEDNYYTYKVQTEKAYELLALLNGNGKGHIKAYDDIVGKDSLLRKNRNNNFPNEQKDYSGYYCDTDRNKPVKKTCDKDDPSPECKGAWNDFWEEHQQYTEEELNAMCDATTSAKKGKVNKWILPVEPDPSGEYFVTFPDDLLDAADLKEGDSIEWVDQGDGSYKMIKVKQPSWVRGNELARVKTYQEMIDDGWTMTDDGFWIKEN
jgi:bifunctional DNA-binding transcriptional regulator/antitoxin component of YhaV-PrlF toxin-antitoxin module